MNNNNLNSSIGIAMGVVAVLAGFFYLTFHDAPSIQTAKQDFVVWCTKQNGYFFKATGDTFNYRDGCIMPDGKYIFPQ